MRGRGRWGSGAGERAGGCGVVSLIGPVGVLMRVRRATGVVRMLMVGRRRDCGRCIVYVVVQVVGSTHGPCFGLFPLNRVQS